MLAISDEEKKAYYEDGYFNRYIMHFPDLDLTIDNETIHTESVEIKESICGDEDLTLGGCIASSCEFEVSEIIQNDLGGLEFTATLETVDEDGNVAAEIPMGKYRVDSAGMVDDKDYKKVVAYDALYDASVDVADWYNALFPVTGTKYVTKTDDSGEKVTVAVKVYGSTTLKKMRESLLKHLGIAYEEQPNLPNDDVVISKTIEPAAGSLSGTTMLKYICAVHGGFGRINRQGLFKVLLLGTSGLYPEETLFPAEDLYPMDIDSSYEVLDQSDNDVIRPEYITCKSEEYTVPVITGISIRTESEDEGCLIGSAENPYLIVGNILLYGKAAGELKMIGKTILEQIDHISYRPNETESVGLPYMEVGDVYLINKQKAVDSYIFNRTLKGIQNLRDTYEAKGNIVRSNEVSQQSEITQLQGKTLRIQKNIDQVSIQMEDLAENTATSIEQTNNRIVLKLTKDGEIAEVALEEDAEKGKVIKISADNIELSAEEAISLMSGGTLDLSGKKIKIESDNFTVTEEGEVTAKSLDISGGSISLVTSDHGDNLICLRNVSFDTGEYSISYHGNGSPTDLEEEVEAEIGEYYLDLDKGDVWLYTKDQSGVVTRWIKVYTCPDYNKASYEECTMNTSDGVTAATYQLKAIEDISSGTSESVTVKEGTMTSLEGEGVHFHKDIYSDSMGSVRADEIDAYISVSEYYDESNKAQPEFTTDAPLSVPKISAGNLVSGQVAKNLTKDTRYYVHVDLEGMEDTPNVMVTPETTNPSAVSVSVANVSNSGFDIYMYRNDTNGNLRVYWIAMC